MKKKEFPNLPSLFKSMYPSLGSFAAAVKNNLHPQEVEAATNKYKELCAQYDEKLKAQKKQQEERKPLSIDEIIPTNRAMKPEAMAILAAVLNESKNLEKDRERHEAAGEELKKRCKRDMDKHDAAGEDLKKRLKLFHTSCTDLTYTLKKIFESIKN